MPVFKVSNQVQLNAQLRSVSSGDTIVLSSGTYNDLTLTKEFTNKVTITSADSKNPAVINKVLLNGVENVELKGLKLDYSPSKSSDTPFFVVGGKNIEFTDITLEGERSGSYGKGLGLRVKNAEDFSLVNSEVSDFKNGLSFSNVKDLKISGNDFRGMSNDSMLIMGAVGVLIEKNDFRDMNSPSNVQHKDMIQFGTGSQSQPASRDVVVRDNVIVNDEESHSIFFTNASANSGNRSDYHRNILIEGNNIKSNHVHGISVNHGDGVTIRDNVVEQYSGGSNIPLINVSRLSADVLVRGNDVASVPIPQNSTWTITDNDTGAKQRQHWYGDFYGAPNLSPPKSSGAPAKPDTGNGATVPPPDAGDVRTVGASGGGSRETFRISGNMLDDDATLRIADVDFDGGDRIIFGNLDDGTFSAKRGGNPIDFWGGRGDSVTIDDMLDLRELVAFSSDLSASTAGDRLVLRIDQKAGVSEIVFDGLGGEYRAADNPELF